MGGRTRRPTTPPASLGPELLRVLKAVCDERVWRDDCDGQRRGMWALYRLDDADVGLTVRALARYDLVTTPLLGAPQVTGDGSARLGRER